MWGGKEGLRQEMQELGSEMGLEAVLMATDLSMPQPPEPELRDHPESPPTGIQWGWNSEGRVLSSFTSVWSLADFSKLHSVQTSPANSFGKESSVVTYMSPLLRPVWGNHEECSHGKSLMESCNQEVL